MQKRIILVLLVGFLASGTALAQAYKWVDEDGVVHYSDRPQPGAEQVDLTPSKPARRRAVRRAPDSATAPRDAVEAEAEAPFRYESLSVASPAAEETLWNIAGVLNVTLAANPALQPGHQVRVYFDGVPQRVTGTSFQLQEVHRGAHNLQAEILDASGTLMIRSTPSRFYVQQTSVLRPR